MYWSCSDGRMRGVLAFCAIDPYDLMIAPAHRLDLWLYAALGMLVLPVSGDARAGSCAFVPFLRALYLITRWDTMRGRF